MPQKPAAFSIASMLRGLPDSLAQGQPRAVSRSCAKPSIRLIVERERERIAFISAGYWSTISAPQPRLRSLLVLLLSMAQKLPPAKISVLTANRGKVVAIDEARAHSLAEGLRNATVSVRSVDTKPYRSSPWHRL